MQRKIWAAADFQNFLARLNTRRPRKKGGQETPSLDLQYRSSPSDAVYYFLVSHVTGWAILGYPVLELDTGIFPFVFFFGHSLAAKFKFEFEKNMPYRESEPGARRSNSCLVFVWQLECLNGNGSLRLFAGGRSSRRSETVAGSIPDAQPLSTPSTHVRKLSLPVWQDERATRPYTHWHLFRKCKTTTPGASESDFCRQVWSQCKQLNIGVAVKVAWAITSSVGASRPRKKIRL